MLLEKLDKRPVKSPIDWRLHILVFFIAFAIVVSRRPDVLFNAQFWAEDGKVWYTDAYHVGFIRSLLLPYAGYLHIVPRLTAGFAQFFPLALAPLIFNLVAIVIQVLPVNFVISARFSALIPSLPARVFLAFAYLAQPSSYEINATITAAQWHLALLGCMVIFASPSQPIIWRFFDIGVILLSSWSGPFSILLIPIALVRWWLHRQRWLLVILPLLSVGALIQSWTLAHATRAPAALGATPKLFAKILGGQVFVATLIGQNGYEWIISHHLWNSSLAVLVSIIGLSAFFYALFKAPLELRLFIVFAALIFVAGIKSPAASNTIPQWEVLWWPGVGGRYWFFPMLAFIATLVWMLSLKKQRNLRIVATLALAIMFVGITLDWHHPAFVDLKFREYANKFVQAPQGTKVKIPINPPPDWFMELTKH